MTVTNDTSDADAFDTLYGDPAEVSADEYEEMTGEPLSRTVDLAGWKRDLAALTDFDRLASEVQEAESFAADVRRNMRQRVYPLIDAMKPELPCAGIYRVPIDEIAETQRTALMNGLVEACDGNVHVVNTLALQIVQIAVVGVSYKDEEETWSNRIFKRDIRVQAGADMVEETIRLLERRSPGSDGAAKRKTVSEMMRRGIMTYMERQILADTLKAPWRMGHGNPLAYELLTGSGSTELIEMSVPVLERLVDHRKFVYVASETNQLHIKTIGDALEPLEYAIVTDARDYVKKIQDGGYRGVWRTALAKTLEPFLKQAGHDVVIGTYRASAYAPPQIFFGHRDMAHEAARIAMADSVHLDHRGFPMMIDMADRAQTLEQPTFVALGESQTPFRHLGERTTRNI